VLTHSAAGQSQGIAPTKYQKNCGQVLRNRRYFGSFGKYGNVSSQKYPEKIRVAASGRKSENLSFIFVNAVTASEIV